MARLSSNGLKWSYFPTFPQFVHYNGQCPIPLHASPKGPHNEEHLSPHAGVAPQNNVSELASPFKHVPKLVKIVLVLPVHTAQCERGFSQMNNIMTHQSTNLTMESMHSLLTIKMSGFTFDSYDPVGAICKWSPIDLPDTRKRCLNSKPYGPSPQTPCLALEHQETTKVTEIAAAEPTAEPAAAAAAGSETDSSGPES